MNKQEHVNSNHKKTEGVVKENKGVVQGKGETQQKILTSVSVRGYDGRTVQMVVH